jgi:hypothetical protein
VYIYINVQNSVKDCRLPRNLRTRCYFKLYGPHTHTVLPSVLIAQLITAQLDRVCVGNFICLCS